MPPAPERRHPHGVAALFALSLACLAGCSTDDESPEAQVREVIARAEAAAEDRDFGAFRDLISCDYQDGEGRDKRAAGALLRLYLIRNQSIHLLTRIEEITFPTPELATAIVTVGMIGRAAEDQASAWLRADLYEFRVSLEDTGGEWQFIRADWRRVGRE